MIAVADRRLLLPPNLAVPLTPIIVLARSAVAVSCPADVTEDTLATISIPAGAMGPNGILRVSAMFSVTNSANTKTFRLRLGGTQLASAQQTTVVTHLAYAQIANRNAANSQVTNNQWSLTASSTGAVAATAIDTTLVQSMTITGQKGLNTETLTLESYLVELLYGA